MVEALDETAACATCGRALDGPYCSQCGEERLDTPKRTVRHFVTKVLLPEILNLDGKIWRTSRLLLYRPGFLAVEHAVGRRRPYVNPVRILLTAIIVYVLATQSGTGMTFLGLSIAPATTPPARSIGGTLDTIDRFGVLERMFTEKMGAVEAASADVRSRFNETLSNAATALGFTTVVFLAAALHACFHRRRPLFVEHAVFSMHYFSFVLLSTLLAIVVIRLRLIPSIGWTIAFLFALFFWQFAYLLVAVRRFYWTGDSRTLVPWGTAAVVSVLLYLLNATFITGVQLVAGAIAIWRL